MRFKLRKKRGCLYGDAWRLGITTGSVALALRLG
jgi:hypothetical protein